MSGFDAPADKKMDAFGRWRFAQEVARVATDAPPDWSVRVGIYGEWGAGKTTALRYVASQVTQKEHLPVWLNPWHAQDESQMWTTLVIGMLEAASKAKLEIDDDLQNKLRAQNTKVRKLLSGASKTLQAASGGWAVGGAALDAVIELFGVRELLDLGRSQAQQIIAQAPTKRFVVMIDDLDRASPSIVGPALFALKEVLDVPGMSFVMAFDPKVVVSLVSTYYGNASLGGAYLEKIIDFPRTLPRPGEQQVIELALSTAPNYVRKEVVAAFAPLLGSNPRRVKRFMQGLTFLENEVLRHDADELSWDLLLPLQMLQIDTPMAFEILLRDEAALLRKRIYDRYHKARSEPERGRQLVHDSFELEDVEKNEAARAESILEILFLRVTSFIPIETYIYHAFMLERPHAVTWKEFRSFLQIWKTKADLQTISDWLITQAGDRNVNESDVLAELRAAARRHYVRTLEVAASVRPEMDLAEHVESAHAVLTLLHQLHVDICPKHGGLPTSEFVALMNTIASFFHFRKPPAYLPLRSAEEKFLVSAFDAIEQDHDSLLAPLLAHDASWQPDLGKVVDRLLMRLTAHLFDTFFARFVVPGGLADFSFRPPHWSYHLLLSSAEHWTSERVATFELLIPTAKANGHVQGHFAEFFELLWSRNEGVLKSAFVPVMIVSWRGMMVQPVQYRAVGTYAEYPAKFRLWNQAELPLPDWWDDVLPNEDEAQE